MQIGRPGETEVPTSATRLRRGLAAILPAGGRILGVRARGTNSDLKALIPIGGETILAKTIKLLRATGRVGCIIVVGPQPVQDEARQHGADEVVAEGGDGPENCLRGLDAAMRGRAQPERALFVATDLPFLTTESVIRFVDACPASSDIAAAVVSRKAFESRFPGTASRYVPLRDGAVTLGCLFLADPRFVLRNRDAIERAFAARKSNLAMARLLGAGVVGRYLARRLAIADIEARCARVLLCKPVAVCDMAAETAFDIDCWDDLSYAHAHCARHEESLG